MQILTTWPGDSDLPVPAKIKEEVLGLLIEPFQSEDEAKQFWQNYCGRLVLLTSIDDLSRSAELSDQNIEIIKHALCFPEFVEVLSEGYQLSLSIMNDEGCGIYLLYAPHSPFIELIGKGF